MTELEKAVKALEAAVRKANRNGIAVKVTYTVTNDDGSTQTYNLGGER